MKRGNYFNLNLLNPKEARILCLSFLGSNRAAAYIHYCLLEMWLDRYLAFRNLVDVPFKLAASVLTGKVIRRHIWRTKKPQNVPLWCKSFPQVFRGIKIQYPSKNNVCAGILGDNIISHLFLAKTLTENHLRIL